MRVGIGIAVSFVLTGCLTMSGTYVLSAHDASGKNLTEKMRLVAEGTGIYTIRNALCQRYPKSLVVIKDAKTGEELRSESPYRCS